MYVPGSARPTTGVTIAVPGAPRRVSEKRAGRRQRVLLPAILTYAKGTYRFDCIIRDLSANGARIAVSKNTQIPGAFFLINIRDKVAYDAKVVRRAGLEAGLWLSHAIDLTRPGDPAVDFVRRIWVQRAARS